MTADGGNRDKLRGLNQPTANEPSGAGQKKSPTPQADSTTAGSTTTPAAAPLAQTETTTKGVSSLARTIFIALAAVGVFFTAAMVPLLVAPISGGEDQWSALVQHERASGRMKADDSTVVVLSVGSES